MTTNVHKKWRRPLLSKYLRERRARIVGPYVRGSVLDLGCHVGRIRRRFGDRIDDYVGIDRRSSVIEEARARYPQHDFHVMDLNQPDLHLDRSFDTIVGVAVVEHISNQAALFRFIKEHLAITGEVVLTTPTPLGNDVVHALGARLGLFSKRAMRDHRVVYNRARFEIVGQDHGLRVVKRVLFQLGCNQLVVLGHARQ